MRKAAFAVLIVLGSLHASSLSSLHVDQLQSHAVLCEPASARPDCHSDLPHEHTATHAGEESLFEHIFQVSREAPVTGLAFCLGSVFFQQAPDVTPSHGFACSIRAVGLPHVSRLFAGPTRSRAPPASAKA